MSNENLAKIVSRQRSGLWRDLAWSTAIVSYALVILQLSL